MSRTRWLPSPSQTTIRKISLEVEKCRCERCNAKLRPGRNILNYKDGDKTNTDDMNNTEVICQLCFNKTREPPSINKVQIYGDAAALLKEQIQKRQEETGYVISAADIIYECLGKQPDYENEHQTLIAKNEPEHIPDKETSDRMFIESFRRVESILSDAYEPSANRTANKVRVYHRFR